MNVEDVRRKVDEIDAESGDPEMAHGLEDDLYVDVLRDIAEAEQWDAEDVVRWKAMARLALTVKEMDFSRWYA